MRRALAIVALLVALIAASPAGARRPQRSYSGHIFCPYPMFASDVLCERPAP
jgi:hypothetical protein